MIEADGIEGALLRYVAEEVAADATGLKAEEDLVTSGRVDSLGLLQIVAFVEARWRVDLLAAGGPRDLTSIAALAAAIRRESAGARRAEGA